MNFRLPVRQSVENRIFFYLMFAGILLIAYVLIKPLLSLIVLAILVAGLFYPIYKKIYKFSREKNFLAVPLTMLSIFLSFIIPIIAITVITINQLNVFIGDVAEFAGNSEEISKIINSDGEDSGLNTDKFTHELEKSIDDINYQLEKLPFVNEANLLTIEDVQQIIGDLAKEVANWAGSTAVNIVQTTPTFITNFIVFIIILSTLIPSQKRLKDYILKLSPMNDKIDKLYLTRINAMANAMIKGTFVIAVTQGLISGLLLWIAGVPYIFFWTILCIFLSVIPNGGAVVNWPIVIILFLTGNVVGALVVLLGNLLVVASVDQILRPILVPKEANLPPALTLLGIVGGLHLFGVFGVVYGPVIMIFLITTFDIYIEYYKE
ncbi:AI-2E family transporter [Candidatus Dojkabacteria bacterium]|uniref:AI-2E family transporter n=1 Tax=Candidatus Dojkabacteria bacterium TaxID=2099670 RepID=A0A955LA76_9BACT|nr:AI-2E family transporter [Candidatus Dojkabacteria bacterium]